jgi:hypothetical protein
MPKETAMKHTLIALFILLATATLYAQALTLHVTSYKHEHVGDKPATHSCKDYPCTIGICTVEGWTENSNPKLVTAFVIQCKSWILLGNPPTSGQCWGLRVGGNYAATQDGGKMLFFDDTSETDPVYNIVEAAQRPKDRSGK